MQFELSQRGDSRPRLSRMPRSDLPTRKPGFATLGMGDDPRPTAATLFLLLPNPPILLRGVST